MKLSEPETERQRKLFETIVFIGKLLLLGLFFRLLIAIIPGTYPLQAALAQVTATILNTTGIQLQLQGALLIGENASYLITQDCLGWKSIAAYTGLLVASTNDYRKIIKPLLLGTIALIIINVVRIVTTVYLSHQGIISFDVIHSFLWRWGLTGFVFLFWLTYIYKTA